MMKILLLSPYIDAQHKIVRELEATGVGVLLAESAEEAAQMLQLHGKSLDLVVLNRESRFGADDDGGFEFLARIKSDPSQADLPLLITSARWADTEFAQHQASPMGGHAYLRWPFDTDQLQHVIQAMFGISFQAPSEPEAEVASPSHQADESGVVLEDSASLMRETRHQVQEHNSISLEAHDETSPSNALVLTGSLTLEEPPVGTPSAPVAEQEGGITLSGLDIPLSSPSEAPAAITEVAASGNENSIDIDFSLPEASDLGEATELTPVPQAVEPAEPAFVPEAGEAEILAADDPALVEELPYLFGGTQSGTPGVDPAMIFAQPVGDAIVPGGAAQSPDVETLKRYLLLREQDVAVLSAQMGTAKDQIATLERALKEERSRNAELTHAGLESQRKLAEKEKQDAIALDSAQSELSELRFQLKAKADKVRLLETQVREASDEIERLKERVRSDIRKIRVREKELENRLEIMKKDSEALIAGRENKIVELKRKIDLLEFNMDLLQDQYSREKESSAKLRERLLKAAKVVRVAEGLLESDRSNASEDRASGSAGDGLSAEGSDREAS